MTKNQLIDYLYDNHVTGDLKIEEMAEDICLDGLRSLPSFDPEIEKCRDCISRKAVLDIFAEKCDAVRPYHEAWQAVIALPTVTPEWEKGC